MGWDSAAVGERSKPAIYLTSYGFVCISQETKLGMPELQNKGEDAETMGE
jgi:hypothetical protein